MAEIKVDRTTADRISAMIREGVRVDDIAEIENIPKRLVSVLGECQDFCVWGGYSRGSPTRLPFVFEMQYARPVQTITKHLNVGKFLIAVIHHFFLLRYFYLSRCSKLI